MWMTEVLKATRKFQATLVINDSYPSQKPRVQKLRLTL